MEVRQGSTPTTPKPILSIGKFDKSNLKSKSEMAIYHFSVKTISRSDGRSAVAAAAYRSGEKLTCDYYGKEQDYTKKTGVEFTNLYAPENTNPDLLDRNQLWNEVEKVERRKDACLAREFEVAFPQELDKSQRQKLLDDLCQDLVKKYGVVVDAAIHAPHTDGGSDERNYHAHVMFTTRSINEHGELSAKKYRDFNREMGSKTVTGWREHFAGLANQHLEQGGHDARVDHRSYKDQGLELEATQHEGPEVTHLRRQGIETEISLKNDAIKQRNLDRIQLPSQIKGLNQEIVATERLMQQLQANLEEAQQQRKAELELEQQQKEAEKLQADLENAYEQFIELQAHYIDFAKSFYAKGAHATKQLEMLDRHLEKTEKWLSKQHGVYYLQGTFYDNYHHKPVDVQKPHFFTTSYETGVKKEEVLKQYRKDVAKLFDDFDIEATVVELKQSGKKLGENGIELPVQKPTFMQRLKGEYVHSFDNLDNFATDMKPVFNEYKAELSHAEKEEREKLKRKKDEEQLKQRMEAHKRKEEEELALEMQRRNEASELVKRQRLAAQSMQPEKKSLENDSDYRPPI